MGQDFKDKAVVIAPPPLIFAALLILGLLIHRAFPVRFLPDMYAVRQAVGIFLLIVPTVLSVLSLITLWKRNTTVGFNKPTAEIVNDGPFRFTRNPLYVSLLLFYCGIAVLLNSLWFILLLPVMFVVIDRGVVRREEKYLEQKFGEEYLRYKKSVRRWI
ncbi:MAG: isoprenylcysteine carboxylmethyltransferase family protein [Nitrospirota bacterium]|nr:isoprenylcysteine carboxylmethyltransferase family protein [Nitrospirota bacterium]